jgi:hypothetical protein
MERLFLNIRNELKGKLLKVKVKPGAKENSVEKWDNEAQALEIKLKAAPEKGKANIELLKFLKKELGIKARIKSGMTSREKILEIIS